MKTAQGSYDMPALFVRGARFWDFEEKRSCKIDFL